MKKLKLIKSIDNDCPKYSERLSQLKNRLSCQFEVPGIGRLRTGKQHGNFHITHTSVKNSNAIVKRKSRRKMEKAINI
ncbi:MAG: hypothetical protein J7K40_08495 [candidate division Zixibacteria bacterium]|nr:hypothetical protein [candidate division Zixibacteria bacterium]